VARYSFDSAFERHFINICGQAESMAQASLMLGMNYKTLCFHAKRLGCFKPNQAGKGKHKKPSKDSVLLEDIFAGTCQTYQTHKLKKRLIAEGYKIHKCESCEGTEWLGKPIPLEFHHIDANKMNNALKNIALLCPNCHALTPNYRAKNIKNLSARLVTADVEPFKFGETLTGQADGNPEPSSTWEKV
jgi:hypothetical protein